MAEPHVTLGVRQVHLYGEAAVFFFPLAHEIERVLNA